MNNVTCCLFTISRFRSSTQLLTYNLQFDSVCVCTCILGIEMNGAKEIERVQILFAEVCTFFIRCVRLFFLVRPILLYLILLVVFSFVHSVWNFSSSFYSLSSFIFIVLFFFLFYKYLFLLLFSFYFKISSIVFIATSFRF